MRLFIKKLCLVSVICLLALWTAVPASAELVGWDTSEIMADLKANSNGWADIPGANRTQNFRRSPLTGVLVDGYGTVTWQISAYYQGQVGKIGARDMGNDGLLDPLRDGIGVWTDYNLSEPWGSTALIIWDSAYLRLEFSRPVVLSSLSWINIGYNTNWYYSLDGGVWITGKGSSSLPTLGTHQVDFAPGTMVQTIDLDGQVTYFHGFQINASITPEPSTMLLFGSAAGLMAWLRRRKKGSNNSSS